MEWINPKYPVADSETVIKENGILTDLNSIGDYSSLYSMDLLNQIYRPLK